MSDVVNVLVAVAVIVVAVRWFASGKESPEQATASRALGFTPKRVTEEMVTTVSTMFPDLPRDNVKYDLLRTGSVEATTNKILERGYLDAPPEGYYTIYPRSTTVSGGPTQASTGASSSAPAKAPSLIDRLNLSDRINSTPQSSSSSSGATASGAAGGKAAWEDSAAKREASLRERKAQMVLAARQRMLAKQTAEAGTLGALS